MADIVSRIVLRGKDEALAGMREIGDSWVSLAKTAVISWATVEGAVKFKEMIDASTELGKHIEDTSRKMNLSTDSYQKLGYMAKMSGANVDNMGRAFSTLSKEAVKSNSILGISTKDINGNVKDTGDLFQELLMRISDIPNPTERMAVSMKVFGMSGREVFAMASQGKDKLKDLAGETDKYGLVLNKTALEGLAKAKEEQELLNESWKAASAKITAGLAPAIIAVMPLVISFAEAVGKMFGPVDKGDISKQLAKEKIDSLKMEAQSLEANIKAVGKNKDAEVAWMDETGNMRKERVRVALAELAAIKEQIGMNEKLANPPAPKTAGSEFGDLLGGKTKKEKENKGLSESIKNQQEALKIISQANMNENEKELDDLKRKYSEEYQLAWKNGQDTAAIVQAYNTKKDEVNAKEEKRQWDIIYKGSEDNKKLMDKMNKEKAEASKHADSIIDKQLKKTYSGQLILFKKSQNDERVLLKHDYDQRKISHEQYVDASMALDNEQHIFEQKLTQEKITWGLNYAKSTLGYLSEMADGFKANAQLKKRLGEAEVVIDTAKAVMNIWAGQTVPAPAGPILSAAESALAIGAGIAEIAKIESTKMAYGGIAHGGIPGVDSIPVLMQEGEIAYNPAHPNPALASMISGGTTTNNQMQTTHISGPTIHVHGDIDSKTVKAIGNITQKALINAIKTAQVNGNISASGLVIRH